MFRHVVKEQLKVPAKIDYLGELRDFVTKVGHRHGFSERVINAFKLSIDEAATNIIKHAYRDWEGDITIRSIVKKNSLTIVLVDQGKYFDPRQVSDPDLQRYVEIGKKGGLGIFIMRRLLDGIDYRKTEEGNELWMIKNRDVARHRKISVPSIPMTLKARYWVVSMAAVSFIILLVYSFFYFRQDDRILSDYIDRGRSACSLLAREIAGNIEQPDFPQEVREQLLQPGGGSFDLHAIDAAGQPIAALKNTEYRDILFNAFVVDNSGGILASAKDTQLLETFTMPKATEEVRKDIYRYDLSSGEKVLDIIWPVVDSKNRLLCSIHFHINDEQISKEIAKARLNDLNLALLIWALVAAGLFLLIYIVMNPFRRLSEWVKMLGQPGVAEEMDIDATTEVGEIAQAFSDITQKLRESQVNLAEQERLQKEMQVAQEIQQTLLPNEFPEIEGYEIASYYAAAKEVGGDYYDFVEVDKDTLGIVVADVSGKGVPGSLVMTMIRTALRTEARGLKDAAEVLSRVNDFVVNDMKKGMFVTLFYVIIDSKRRRLNFASAGHNPMILYRASTNKTYYLNPRGFPIGISLPEKDLFKNSIQSDSLALAEGDILIMYTDGVTEAMNRKRHLFGEERFLNVIRSHGRLRAKGFAEELQKELLSFTEGNPQNDDITLVAISEKTSAEKIELERAKKAYSFIKGGKSIREACGLAGLTPYAYSKYKEVFAKEGVEAYEIAGDVEAVEAKHLSIEEKTKIYDVIRRFPEYGAKRISEELNTERYAYTQIAANKIYEELVQARLNTKELREAFISRGGKKRRIKPPGTPMLTLDGQVVIKRSGFEPEPEVEEEETLPARKTAVPVGKEEVSETISKAGLPEEKASLEPAPVPTTQAETEISDIEAEPHDILNIGVDELLTSPIEDLLDRRKTLPAEEEVLQPPDLTDTEQEATGAEDLLQFEYASNPEPENYTEEESEAEAITSLMVEPIPGEEVVTAEPEQVVGLEAEPETDESDAQVEAYFDFDYAGDDDLTLPTPEEGLAEVPAPLSEEEQVADLDIPPDVRLLDAADQDEVDVAAVLEAGIGIDVPQPQAAEEFAQQEVEDVEIVSEEETTRSALEEPALTDGFDELLEIEEEFGLITPEGELNRVVAEKLTQNEKNDLPQEDDFAVLLPERITWDIRESYVAADGNNGPEAAEKHRLSFDELMETLSEESLTSGENTGDFDLLIDDEITDPFDAKEHNKLGYASAHQGSSMIHDKESMVKEAGMANAIKLYESENFTAAINEAIELARHYPDDCKIHVLLGNAYFRAQRYQEAAIEYEKVIRLDPRSVDAYENLGVVYANQGDLHRAVHQWEKLLGISPERKDIRDSINRAKRFLEQA